MANQRYMQRKSASLIASTAKKVNPAKSTSFITPKTETKPLSLKEVSLQRKKMERAGFSPFVKPQEVSNEEIASLQTQVDQEVQDNALPAFSGTSTTQQNQNSLLQAQPQPATASPQQGNQAAKNVTFKISWSGKFGGDVDADVIVFKGKKKGKNIKKTKTKLASGSGQNSLDLTADFEDHVYIEVTPTNAAPDDRYKRTSKTISLEENQTSLSTSLKLNVNRWNLKNVDDVWEEKDIDPDKAAKVKRYSMLGHKIQLNEAVEPRVNQTNTAFAALPPKTQKEITDSIIIIGGYAKRTTSRGSFSNHSIGCSFDVNYNMDTKQNHHFHKDQKKDKKLLGFVQEVVRKDPNFSSFDIWEAEGMEQLNGSKCFNRMFPNYLLQLLDPDNAISYTATGALIDIFTETAADFAGIAAPNTAEDLSGVIKQTKTFDSVTKADINAALKTAKDGTERKKHLALISQEWSSLQAWIKGAIPDGKSEELEGMIPLHEEFLKLMLACGWSWGGDWSKAKDYMHFEDKDAFKNIKK